MCVCGCGCLYMGMCNLLDLTMPIKTWTMMEKSLAILGATPRPKVMTGNATAPPPSLVIPECVHII